MFNTNMYNTFINQNANAFNLNLSDNFNMNQNKTQINNSNMKQFNNMMNNNKKYNNNAHDFDYNKKNSFNNNNNNFNDNNFDNNMNNFNDNNFDNNMNNFNYNFNYNNSFNFDNNYMMNMFNFLNTTWGMYQFYNQNQNQDQNQGQNQDFSTMRLVKKDSSNDIDVSQLVKKKSKTIIDLEPNYLGNKINIFFQNSSGTKTNVLSPSDTTVEKLLSNYAIKMGISEDAIDKAIYFLFNGGKLKKNNKNKIYNLGILNGTIIIVYFILVILFQLTSVK